MKARTIWALVTVCLLAATLSYGQKTLKVKIDFPFTVAGKVLAPGDYEFIRDMRGEYFTVQGQDKKGVEVPIMTRITKEMRADQEEPRLVFDKVGDAYLLSEIWLANEDGYVVLVTKGIHEHKVMKGM